nr:flagellar filament capping protein FliD [Sphingopyxis sp.]
TAATPPANGGIGEDGAGALRGNTGLEDLRRRLAALPTTALTSGTGGPTTLSEIGVRTNRDGTLSVDSVRLNNALTNNPDAVEAMFNPSITSSSPAITARSASGRTTPGTYTLTDMVPGTPPSGRINGVAMMVSGNDLIAPASSAAAGLIVTLGNGAPATGTVTVEPGLGGALQLIRDSLRSSGSAFAGTNERLARESRAIAEDRATLERRSAQEYNRLLATYAAMDRNVSAFRATQGYLEQQVKLWTNDRG